MLNITQSLPVNSYLSLIPLGLSAAEATVSRLSVSHPRVQEIARKVEVLPIFYGLVEGMGQFICILQAIDSRGWSVAGPQTARSLRIIKAIIPLLSCVTLGLAGYLGYQGFQKLYRWKHGSLAEVRGSIQETLAPQQNNGLRLHKLEWCPYDGEQLRQGLLICRLVMAVALGIITDNGKFWTVHAGILMGSLKGLLDRAWVALTIAFEGWDTADTTNGRVSDIKWTYQLPLVNRAVGSSEDCSVCLNGHDDPRQATIDGRHFYHPKCLLNWCISVLTVKDNGVAGTLNSLEFRPYLVHHRRNGVRTHTTKQYKVFYPTSRYVCCPITRQLGKNIISTVQFKAPGLHNLGQRTYSTEIRLQEDNTP